MVGFGPDGSLLATGSSDGTVRLWDISDPTTIRLVSINGETGQAATVAFGPDGRLLATGSSDGTVRLWDISDPTHPRLLGAPLTGDTGQVSMVGFGPDGSLLATGSSDGTVRLWDLSTLQVLRTDAVQVACQRAGRGLDRQEWINYLPDEPYRDTCRTGTP
ncbi:WD-40 repeat protein [Parafrankia sp. EUN1f]|nr:WD-40 repeat protein [Parafrankia sp. EUN1f]